MEFLEKEVAKVSIETEVTAKPAEIIANITVSQTAAAPNESHITANGIVEAASTQITTVTTSSVIQLQNQVDTIAQPQEPPVMANRVIPTASAAANVSV